ncbi:SDR family NAD(P)-dependent oxidoreductase [Desulfosporosinus sp. PR]|uniref:SDR family NAD(P)-dependent oxidoreductase n=1 Tax=Candidatus Desulfosporosinus nitrosoreducens TaxID=3401928 RepID=UPI0027E83A14|nr:SDR family NAD(P)-dependent oxidoreductase [Desulfosporosinus sp. PR]MDQ7093626.1 SDR family NAD(P)-dependent oxidoreductase [Desulfosporosinus sp. PR]
MDGNKTVIITGGNSGLGFECARNIAKNAEYRVILACRDMKKAEQAKDSLISESGNTSIEAMELDISSLASVRAFTKRYKERNLPLSGLICNAGINGSFAGQSPDGFDIVFATNHLGHFLLTNLLLPAMLPSARIAVVSSDMHNPPGADLTWLNIETLAHPGESFQKGFVRYSYSKLCNLYFTYELSARLVSIGSDITVNALNPGLMTDTGFAPDKSRYTDEFLRQVSDRIGSLPQSGDALAQMITSPDLAQVTGKYFDRSTKRTESSPLSYSKENALELWHMSVTYTELAKDETLQELL